MLDDDADSLIRANQEPHDILRDRRPTPDYLWIGCDGGESHYYIDLRVTSSPVYEFDLEVGDLTSCADNLGDFVSKCRSIDQEFEEEEQLSSQKRWWRFW
jgi:thiamine pyrophosphokinase